MLQPENISPCESGDHLAEAPGSVADDPSASPVRYRIKVALTLSSALLLLGVIGAAFWYQDLRYSLPTPRPEHLASVPPGSAIPVAQLFPKLGNDKRLLLLHFFNPDCPCSRFNVDHIRSLQQHYRDQVRFMAVVQTEPGATPSEAQRTVTETSHRLAEMEAVADLDGRIAAACGVYSTPQAVILSSSGDLLFRGNYNLSRFCTNQRTEFARVALDLLVDGKSLPEFPPIATTAYGCQLPTATEDEK